uniref:Fe2OG dioxygenase domain-containing protein n=1 Tax=Neobodo designis TaxID=312471 RepID=A0A7S1PT97_NEODS
MLNASECDAMIDVARRRGLQRSRVGEGSHAAIRTSDGVFLDAVDGVGNAPANTALRQRVASILGLPGPDFLEPTQVLRYRPRQRYRPHRDTISSVRALSAGGQRFASVVISLNDPPSDVRTSAGGGSGGGTRFPLVNVTLRPPAGGGLLFYLSVASPGGGGVMDDPAALHEGLPTAGWTRYVAVLWAHPHEYLLPDD